MKKKLDDTDYVKEELDGEGEFIVVSKSTSKMPLMNLDVPVGGMYNDEIEVKNDTELGVAFKELNSDYIDAEKMPSIDMKTRLHEQEIAGMLAIDTMVGFGVLPVDCMNFNRRKKRMNVSLRGLGREEMRDIAMGTRDKDGMKSTGGVLKKLFGGSGGNNDNR